MTSRLGASRGAEGAVVSGGARQAAVPESGTAGLEDGARGTAVATPETAGVPDAADCGRVGPEAIAAA
jgi:hypothetical protein